MLAVISPAKNLDLDSPLPKVKTSQPALLDRAEALVNQLKPLAPHELSSLMHISDKLGQLNFDRFQQWRRPFNAKNARPAILTFAGDVYQGLDANSFSQNDFEFAQGHLRILSGLYGVLRPLDLMQAYRLEMGTKFTNTSGKDLYAFWQSTITNELNKQLKKLKSNTLVHLASNEYFKSVVKKELNGNIIEPVFKDWKNGDYKIISFFAKKARGQMAAFFIKNQIAEPEDLKQFDWSGYRYNESASTESKWVFLRKET